MEVSGNHFQGENCQKSEPFAKGSDFADFLAQHSPQSADRDLHGSLVRVTPNPFQEYLEKLIKIRALREGLRFFAIYSSKMISRDLHGTFYINTHSISKRSNYTKKKFTATTPEEKPRCWHGLWPHHALGWGRCFHLQEQASNEESNKRAKDQSHH